MQNNFVVKWNNGTWKVFSLWHYSDTDTFDLFKEATHAASVLNQRWAARQNQG